MESWRARLLAECGERGTWEGELSSSAVATAIAYCAFSLAGGAHYGKLMEQMRGFLERTRLADGSWGDSPESPGNMTATLLARVALGLENDADSGELVERVRTSYGEDLTFSAPILALCAAMGAVPWSAVPRLPYQLALLPQSVFRFLRLPVVSYAIPALIAVGLARRENIRPGRLPSTGAADSRNARRSGKYLRRLKAMQPQSGGYLEAAPLTGFVAVCLLWAGHGNSEVVRKCLDFLANSVRKDGGVPIDSNLEIWVTSLAIKSLGREAFSPAQCERFIEWYFSCQQKKSHPFNGTAAGGWGWTSLSGAVPDADDTAAALIALSVLDAPYSTKIENALKWLLSLQNSDGGIATFCRGWGRLPFDRSAPDISAHAWRAIQCWRTKSAMPEKLAQVQAHILRYLQRNQCRDGAWIPLWFGEQDTPSLEAPIYGTAVVLEHLDGVLENFTHRAVAYLLDTQNADGGWGGAPQTPSKIIVTARVVAGLAHYPEAASACEHGKVFLAACGETLPPEPIGLYFAKLWYSEKLYPLIFCAHF